MEPRIRDGSAISSNLWLQTDRIAWVDYLDAVQVIPLEDEAHDGSLEDVSDEEIPIGLIRIRRVWLGDKQLLESLGRLGHDITAQ